MRPVGTYAPRSPTRIASNPGVVVSAKRASDAAMVVIIAAMLVGHRGHGFGSSRPWFWVVAAIVSSTRLSHS